MDAKPLVPREFARERCARLRVSANSISSRASRASPSTRSAPPEKSAFPCVLAKIQIALCGFTKEPYQEMSQSQGALCAILLSCVAGFPPMRFLQPYRPFFRFYDSVRAARLQQGCLLHVRYPWRYRWAGPSLRPFYYRLQYALYQQTG